MREGPSRLIIMSVIAAFSLTLQDGIGHRANKRTSERFPKHARPGSYLCLIMFVHAREMRSALY